MKFPELWRNLLYFLHRERNSAELREEMEFHLELRERQFRDQGIARTEAAARARRQFGNPTVIRERSRELWGWGWLESAAQDLRYGVRGLRRSPALTLVIVLTLGVAIGANTTIFGALHSLFLKRLPLPRAEELVAVRPMHGGRLHDLRFPDFEVVKGTPGAPRLEGYRFDPVTLEGGDLREDVWADFVTGGYFQLLGVKPLLGRVLTEEDAARRAPVAVISEEVWARYFGSDPLAVGRTLRVGGAPFTVVGVMPGEFEGVHLARRFSIALPRSSGPQVGVQNGQWVVSMIARVEPSDRARVRNLLEASYLNCCANAVDNPAVVGEIAAAQQPFARPEDPGPTGWSLARSSNPEPHIALADASRGLTWSSAQDFRGDYRRVLLMVMAGVLILLLIACSNVATLLIARSVARQREFAVRLSIGAGSGRLVRQLLTESVLLAVLGGIAGILLAWVGTSLLIRTLPPDASRLSGILRWNPDPALLAFTFAVMALCTILFGLWPARQAGRTDPLNPLSGGVTRRRIRGPAPNGARLVVGQIALAIVLVCAAGLFVATLHNLTRFDTGSLSVVTALARIDMDDAGLDSVPAGSLADLLTKSALGVPGTISAAVMLDAPWTMDLIAQSTPRLPGEAQVEDERAPVRFNAVTPGFFSLTGIGLLAGREFSRSDRADAEPVAIISEAVARRYFGFRNPIGATLVPQARRDEEEKEVRIIGVARNSTFDDVRSAPTEIWYRPVAQLAPGRLRTVSLLVRTVGEAAAVTRPLKEALEASSPGLRAPKVTSVAAILEAALARERLAAALASMFGFIALLLVAIGVYGLLADTTARRTPEVGIRMAVGATGLDAVWMVLQQTLVVAFSGVLIGVPLSMLALRFVRAQLYGVDVADPRIMVGAALVLLVIALLASLLPARRAARVNPLMALRAE